MLRAVNGTLATGSTSLHYKEADRLRQPSTHQPSMSQACSTGFDRGENADQSIQVPGALHMKVRRESDYKLNLDSSEIINKPIFAVSTTPG
ncbi:hypothetical protein TNCV_2551061 [Trichonephila clavipes]|nr:hypothetical protein TNCV_2551061 [Trichonephila clavipes]